MSKTVGNKPFYPLQNQGAFNQGPKTSNLNPMLLYSGVLAKLHRDFLKYKSKSRMTIQAKIDGVFHEVKSSNDYSEEIVKSILM